MIKKSFVLLFALLTLYEIKLRVGYESNAWGQNQWQNNIVKAQEFLYGEKKNLLITGSSQSAGLNFKESVKANNIAFRAGNSLEGMELITKTKYENGLILVETNSLLNEVDPYFIQSLLREPLKTMRQHVWSLREKNQPVTILSGVVMPYLRTFESDPTGSLDTKEYTLQNELKKSEVVQLRAHKTLSKFKALLELIRQNGNKILLYELPMSQRLYKTKKYMVIRDFVLNELHQYNYYSIPEPQWSRFETTDGIHLTEESQNRFESELLKYIMTNYE